MSHDEHEFVTLFDSKIISNFFNQSSIVKYRFFVFDSTARDLKIIDEMFLRIYLNPFFAMKILDNDDVVYKKTIEFVDANMIDVGVIFKMT